MRKILILSLFLIFNYGGVMAKSKNAPDVFDLSVTINQVAIIDQVLKQAEINTQEINAFLEVSTPFEDLLNMQDLKSADGDSVVTLSMSKQSIARLLIFLERATINSAAAKEVSIIVDKIQSLLPKDLAPVNKDSKKDNDVTKIPFTYQQVNLLIRLLSQIDISVSEVKYYLDAYTPFELALSNKDKDKTLKDEVLVTMSVEAPNNLLILLQRVPLNGAQASIVNAIITKLNEVTKAADAKA